MRDEAIVIFERLVAKFLDERERASRGRFPAGTTLT
jgi:hypothetical protein